MDNGASSYRRFLAGDDNGLVEIVRDYKNGLILYLDGFVKNIYLAEELAEDTFVKLGIKRPLFFEKSSFKTWLYKIGRNLAVDYIRKQSRYGTVSIDECAELSERQSLENDYIKEERKAAIHKAMKNLKPEYRQVLWLVYFEDFSNKDVAKILKKSPHNTETFTYRARKSLKEELIKEGFNYENL